MRSTTAPLTYRGTRFEMITEHYGSMSEVLQVAEQRHVMFDSLRSSDYLGDRMMSGSRDFYGFSDTAELKTMIREGIRDESFASRVRKLRSSIQVKDEDKLCHMRRDVCGGAVNVPAFLQGVPECMVRQTRKPVKSKVLNLVVQSGYVWNTSIEDLEATSYALAMVIASLERTGYRVGVTVTGSFCFDNRRVISVGMPMKKPNEPLNIAKLMFMITSRAFFRGLLFGWSVRCPDTVDDRCLGTSLMHKFWGEDGREVTDAYFRREFGEGTVISVERFIEDMGRVRSDAKERIPGNSAKAKAERDEYVLVSMSKTIEASLRE